MLKRKAFKPRNLLCLAPGCQRFFINASGRTQHMNLHHVPFDTGAPEEDVVMGSPPGSAPGSRASSVSGGGDAAAGAALPPPLLARPPPHRVVEHHPTLNGTEQGNKPCTCADDFYSL
jgi:hypothetical protein